MAYYLKYRPQKLADLDLAEVQEGLAKALSSKDIPHAFLFAGPRGTGKTSAARIVAKAVNCEQQSSRAAEQQRKASQGKTSAGKTLRVKNSKPEGLGNAEVEELVSEFCCNQCDSCFSITAGTNLDVLEIDGASNRGIDDIRNLREKIKLAPTKSRYKVYIIDEVHMLTTEAFNALLKTLEEPPAHAIFILCTTEPHKLPQTIVSRCLRFNFRKAKIEELVKGLEKIVKAEKLRVEKGVLEKVAQAADGSFRDAQKILEQLAFGKAKISLEKVDEILGQVKGAGPEEFLGYLVDKEARGAVLEIGRVVEEGVNLRWYTEQLLELLRLGLLGKLGVETDELLGNTEALKVTEALKIEEIKNLIEIFSRVALELKTAIIPQLPLEMGVVEWTEMSNVKEKVKHFPPKPSNVSLSSGPSLPSDSNVSFDSICQKWPQVLAAVGPKNHSIQAFLRATRPKEFDGETLVLEVFYEFHKTQLESEKCRRLIEETAEVILKTPVKVKCVFGEKLASKLAVKSDLSSLPSQPSSPSGPSFPSLKQSQEEKYHLSLPSQPEVEDDIMKVAEEIFGKTAN